MWESDGVQERKSNQLLCCSQWVGGERGRVGVNSFSAALREHGGISWLQWEDKDWGMAALMLSGAHAREWDPMGAQGRQWGGGCGACSCLFPGRSGSALRGSGSGLAAVSCSLKGRAVTAATLPSAAGGCWVTPAALLLLVWTSNPSSSPQWNCWRQGRLFFFPSSLTFFSPSFYFLFWVPVKERHCF